MPAILRNNYTKNYQLQCEYRRLLLYWLRDKLLITGELCLQRGSLYSRNPTRTAIGFHPAVQCEMTKSFDTQIYYYETDTFVNRNKSRLQEGKELAKCKTEML